MCPMLFAGLGWLEKRACYALKVGERIRVEMYDRTVWQNCVCVSVHMWLLGIIVSTTFGARRGPARTERHACFTTLSYIYALEAGTANMCMAYVDVCTGLHKVSSG